jgi:hypothetical protein
LLTPGSATSQNLHGGAAEEVDAALGHGGDGEGIPTHHRANPSRGDVEDAGSVGGTQKPLNTHGLSPSQADPKTERHFLNMHLYLSLKTNLEASQLR